MKILPVLLLQSMFFSVCDETLKVHHFANDSLGKQLDMIVQLDKLCSDGEQSHADVVFFISPQLDAGDTIVRIWRSFLPGNYEVEWSLMLREHLVLRYKDFTCFLDTASTIQKWYYKEYTIVQESRNVCLNSKSPRTTFHHPVILSRKKGREWETEVLIGCD